MQKLQKFRLLYRIAVFILCVYYGLNPTKAFFPLFKVIYCIALLELIFVLIPVTNNQVSSGKHLLKFYRKRVAYDIASYNRSKRRADVAALFIFVIWSLLIVFLYTLKKFHILNDLHIILVAVLFYMCDDICIHIWCPFKILVGAKCCKTCRIYNWGHIMAFSPLLLVHYFPFKLLGILSLLILLIWEVSYLQYPERFYEQSNQTLNCLENCSCKKAKTE